MKYLGLMVSSIEWYGLSVYFSFINIFVQLYLENPSVTLQLLFSWLSTLLLYVGRPVGALLFGRYSDRKSRLNAAYYSFVLMVVSSFLISVLPSFSSIGMLAPILFMLLLLLQGVAMGGNCCVSVLNVENSINSEKYYNSSFVSLGFMVGFGLGNFVAFLFEHFCSSIFVTTFGWRIALWLSLIVTIPVIVRFPKHSNEAKTSMPNEKIDYMNFFKIFIILFLDMLPFYIFFVFLPSYNIMVLGYNHEISKLRTACSMIVMFVFTPIFAKIADRYGALRNLKATALMLMIIAFFSPWDNFAWSFVFGLIMSICYSSLYGWIALTFSANIRATASSFVLNMAAMVNTAFMPIILAFLIKINSILIALLLFIFCLIIFLVLRTYDEHKF